MIFEALKELFSLLKAFGPWLKSIGKHKAGDVIVKVAQIYDNMKELLDSEEFGIERILILYAHNGGDDLVSGKPSYVSCLHEETRHPFTSVKKDYQRLPLDGEYITMLTSLYLNKEINLKTADLKDSLLKNIYLTEGVDHSRLFFLKHTKEAFWFMSIATSKPEAIFEIPAAKVAITRVVSNIRQRI